MDYIEFASNITFFEFIQEEFKPEFFKVEQYEEEFNVLKNNTLTIDFLVKTLEKYPKLIDIFESLFQMDRFTNAQLIHFCFDVNLINNSDNSTILSHLGNSILKFENGNENEYFSKIFGNINSNNELEKIFYLKKSIVLYVERLLKNREMLYNHIRNSIGCRYRISRYLIENLNAGETVKAVDLKSFLKLKRKPVDTKCIHGKFGSIKIESIFNKYGVVNISNEIKNLSIEPSFSLKDEYKNKLCYVKEKEIEGIVKRNGKPKKFDFIIFVNGKIKYLIETNFYSTSGTKIGINEDEYVNLKSYIEEFNKKNDKDFKFIWITDGNFWLTEEGKQKYENLKKNQFTEEYELLNYKLLESFLECTKK